MPIIPPPPDEEIVSRTNIELPIRIWQALDEISEREQNKEEARASSERRKPIFYSRTRVMRHFLDWAIQQYWTEEGGKQEKAEKKPKK